MKTVDKNLQTKMDCAIAYLMGWRIDNSYPDKDRVWKKGNHVELNTTFKFSTDWNALMEVKEAIETICEVVIVFDSYGCSIYNCDEVEVHVPLIQPPILLEGAVYNSLKDITRKETTIDLKEAVYRCIGEYVMKYNEEQFKKHI